MVGLIAFFYGFYATPAFSGDVPNGPIPNSANGFVDKIPIKVNLSNGQDWLGSFTLFPNASNPSTGIVSFYQEPTGTFVASYNYINLVSSCQEFGGGNPSKIGQFSFIIDGFVNELGDEGITLFFSRAMTWPDTDIWDSALLWDLQFHRLSHNDPCPSCQHFTGFTRMCATFNIP